MTAARAGADRHRAGVGRHRAGAERRAVLAILAIAAAGLALRVAYALLAADRVGGLGDAEELHRLANALGDGRGFVNPFAPPGDGAPPTAHKPPLYPLLLAAVSAPGGTSWTAHQLASAVMGSATVVVLALLATRAAGPRAGLIAAGLGAVYPAFVARDASLHSETLFALLVALALLAAWRVRERPTPARLAVLGAVIALAALTRSEGLLLLALLALPAVWRGGAGRARRIGVVAVVCGLVLAPWLVRCWAAFDRPVAITTSSGDLLAGANCDATYGGAFIGEWAFQCVLGERGANEAVVADRLRARGLRYAREHRGRLPAVMAARVLRPWGFFHPVQEVGLQRAGGGGPRWIGWLGLAVTWALLPAAIAGAVLLRRRREPLAVLLAPVALVVVVSAAAYGILRFRAAGDVAIVVLAAVALDGLVRRRMTSRVGARTTAPH